MSDSLWLHGLYSPWNSPGQNTGVSSLFLLQGIFRIQGSNPGLLQRKWILYQPSSLKVKVAQLCLTLCNTMDCIGHGILQARILEWVAFPFSRGSFQPRDQTQVSHMAGGFFTSWATREAQEYSSGYPILSPVGLPNPGIKLGSPTLQADSLPTELLGKSNRS